MLIITKVIKKNGCVAAYSGSEMVGIHHKAGTPNMVSTGIFSRLPKCPVLNKFQNQNVKRSPGMTIIKY